MSKVSLRRLLSKLTALVLATSALGPATAAAPPLGRPVRQPAGTSGPDEPVDVDDIDLDDSDGDLGHGLALALSEMRPLSATHLVATWSLSEDPLRRLAVARALEWSFPLVGDALVIDHLSRDGDPAIRAATARAAWIRRHTGGDTGVLARLSHDPDPQVRAVAASARPA